mgnify:CR=1 FL=1
MAVKDIREAITLFQFSERIKSFLIVASKICLLYTSPSPRDRG